MLLGSPIITKVAHAYRAQRGDGKVKLLIGHKEISGLHSVTLRSTGIEDKWLHSWTCLRFPGDEESLSVLVSDLTRLRDEFGLHYAFIHPDHLGPFIDHLKALTTYEVRGVEVMYSSDSLKWSPFCKSEQYRYQREFRFVLGKCHALSLEPLIIRSETGFRDFMSKNTSICIGSEEDAWIYFEMNGLKAIIHNQPGKPELSELRDQ